MIITSVHNLTAQQVSPFLETLRRHYSGRLAVLAGDITDPVRRYLKACDAEVYYTSRTSCSPAGMHWNNFRFKFLDYLLTEQELTLTQKDHMVLLCDIRDVIFQGDPFTWRWHHGIHSALENCTIGNSRANFKWMLRSYGPLATWQMRSCRTVCAGTIVMNGSTLPVYAREVAMEIAKRNFVSRWSGLDQAIHNRLMWDGRLNRTRHFHPNWNGPFLTLDNEPKRQVDCQNRWINDDGSVIPIIHQWDRV